MPLSNDMAALIGFACESLLYGAYCVLFILSINFLLFRRRTRHLNSSMLFATVFLFTCCSAHFALEFNHFYTALNETGVVLGFANETLSLQGADMLISICDFVGDMVLLYRCWLVWGRNYLVVVLPFLTSLGGLACIAGVLRLLETMDPNSPTAPPALVPLGLAGYALPLITNALITGLIVYRIWYTSRDARAVDDLIASSPTTNRRSNRASHQDRIAATLSQGTNDTSPRSRSRTRFISSPFSLGVSGKKSHESLGSKEPSRGADRRRGVGVFSTADQIHQAMVIIVESGFLYLATQLVFVVLFALGHPAQAIVAVMAVQIYGIAPTLILFRVALGLAPSEGTALAMTRTGNGNNAGIRSIISFPQWARPAGFGNTRGTVTEDLGLGRGPYATSHTVSGVYTIDGPEVVVEDFTTIDNLGDLAARAARDRSRSRFTVSSTLGEDVELGDVIRGDGVGVGQALGGEEEDGASRPPTMAFTMEEDVFQRV